MVTKGELSVIAAHAGTAVLTVLCMLKAGSSGAAGLTAVAGMAFVALAVLMLASQTATSHAGELQAAAGAWSFSVAAPALLVFRILVASGRPARSDRARAARHKVRRP